MIWIGRNAVSFGRTEQKRRMAAAMRERPRQPLILSGHGVTLRVENGALDNSRRLHPLSAKAGDTIASLKASFSIPERIILLDGSGSVSFDVLSWLAEQGVSLIRMDWRGEVVCVASRSRLLRLILFGCSGSARREADEKKRMEFSITKIISENRKFNFHPRKINSPLGRMGKGDGKGLFDADAIWTKITPKTIMNCGSWRRTPRRPIFGRGRGTAD